MIQKKINMKTKSFKEKVLDIVVARFQRESNDL